LLSASVPALSVTVPLKFGLLVLIVKVPAPNLVKPPLVCRLMSIAPVPPLATKTTASAVPVEPNFNVPVSGGAVPAAGPTVAVPLVLLKSKPPLRRVIVLPAGLVRPMLLFVRKDQMSGASVAPSVAAAARSTVAVPVPAAGRAFALYE